MGKRPAAVKRPAAKMWSLASTAEQPRVFLGGSSAAQPAPKSTTAEFVSLNDCRKWMESLDIESLDKPPIRKLQTAVTILQGRSSRQQRTQLQQVLKVWDVVQKEHGVKKGAGEVKKDLEKRVLQEFRRLRSLPGGSFSSVLNSLQVK